MSQRSWPWSLPTLKKHLGRTQTGQWSAAGSRRRGVSRGAPAWGNQFRSEALEHRYMLTTLIGGQSFVYVDNSLPSNITSGQGELVRVRVEGNIRVELVGAAVSGRTNQAEIANLAGRILSPGGAEEVFGGLGGPGGIDIIGPVISTTAQPDINAIAADESGNMYALQIVPIPLPPGGGDQEVRNLVQLIQLTFPTNPPPPPTVYGPGLGNQLLVTGVVLAEISDEIIAGAGGIFGVNVNSVPAADFNPANGLLYFTATGGEGNIDMMFTVNVNAGSAAAIEGSVNRIPGLFNDVPEEGIVVTDIAFDQVPGGVQLLALMGDDAGGGAGGGGGGGAGGGPGPVIAADNAFIAIVNPTNTNFLTPFGLFVGQGAGQASELGGVTGLEVLDDDPAQFNDAIAVGSGNAYQIFRAGAGFAGLALLLGTLLEPVDPLVPPPPIADETGSEPSDLMFVEGLIDPFTGTAGAYIGYDQATSKLFFINRQEQRGQQIFQIYVAFSDLTGSISISRFPPPPADPAMTPFFENPQGVRHINAQDPTIFPWPVDSAGSDVGVVWIGARTRDLSPGDPNDDLRPLIQATVPPNVNLGLVPEASLAIDPTTGRRIVPAGLTVNGDLNKFMLGGTMTGDVAVSGSLNQFYCGWLLTGNAVGDLQARSPTRPQNFRVGGDLRSLYVLDSVGTHDDTALDAPTWVTGFDLQVGGRLGHVRVGDSWIGAFQVRNQPSLDATVGFDSPQTEMETKGDPAWDAFVFSGNPIFFNDTFDTPEFRNGIATLGVNDAVRTLGVLQHLSPINDWVDYYAVALLAGQSVQVQLFPSVPVLNVGVFDPYNRLIASDYSNTLDVSGQMFQFTADLPGIYRFAVSAFGNTDFVNGRQSSLNTAVPYELRITDIGDLAVGGIEVQNNMLDVIALEAIGQRSYLAEFGDIGALYSRAGAILSLNAVSTVRVTGGNLRSLDGASIGYGTEATPPPDPNSAGTAAGLNAPVQVDVPAGSVGHVRARTGILGFNFGASFFQRPIGGDYQLVDGATSIGVELIADGGLGVLRGGDMVTIPPSVIAVNYDDVGRDGIIDLIDMRGTIGTLNGGGPAISTNTGGNVRYMRAGGLVFIDREFGGGSPIETLHQAGEIVTLKDDGGGTLRIAPTGVPVPNPAFDPAEPSTPITNPQFLFTTPNALTIRSYPIRGSGGVVVMDIISDDSVRIEGSAAGETVEIGTIRLTGDRAVGAPVVRDPNQRIADFTTLLDFFLPGTSDTTNSSGAPGADFEPINPGSGGNLGEGDYRDAPNPLLLQPAPPPPDPTVPGGGGPGTGRTAPAKQELTVIVGGQGKVDVWSIVGEDDDTVGDGQFSLIRNDTPGGEIVNITAVSVGEIVSNGTIGIARPSISNTALFAAQYDPGSTIPFPGDEFPFLLQTTGVWLYGDLDENHAEIPNPLNLNFDPTGGPIIDPLQVDLPEPGSVISIRARDGIGNVIANGSIGEVIPNKDDMRNRPGVFAGIQGVIWARGNTQEARVPFSDEGGDIYFVDIGEGVRASGSGGFARAGIFGARRIDTVQGTNADIRGDIIAGDQFNLPDFQVATVTFNDQLVQSARRIAIPDSIGRVVLRDGSIINADVMVVDDPVQSREGGPGFVTSEFPEALSAPFFELGQVDVRGNGGIIGSLFFAADVGPISVTRGFGMFSTIVLVTPDGRFQGIQADNYGVRGVTVNAGASMNYLRARGDGSSKSVVAFNPSVRRSEPQLGALGRFNIDPLTGMQPNTLTDINAYLGTSQENPEVPGRTDTGILEDIDVRGQRNLNQMRAFQIRGTNPELAPSLVNFANVVSNVVVQDDINGLSMTTGRLNNFRPNADVFNLGLTVAGEIKDLLIKGDLGGSSFIRTEGPRGRMGTIRINGDLDGDIISNGPIKRLFIGGSVNGNVGSRARRGKALGELIIGGGVSEGGINVQGNVGRVLAAGSLGLTGSDVVFTGNVKSITISGDLFSNLKVTGSLGRLTVGGSIITGALVEAGRIGRLTIGQDLQAGAIVRASRIGRPRIGGQLLGEIQIV